MGEERRAAAAFEVCGLAELLFRVRGGEQWVLVVLDALEESSQ